MNAIGLPEFGFSDVYDAERVEDGRKLAKIGKNINVILNIERT